MKNEFVLVFYGKLITCISQQSFSNSTKEILHKGVKFPSQHLHAQVNNRNTRTRCGICSKLAIKTPERRQASF